MNKEKMTEQQKIKREEVREICRDINAASFFDSIYNPDSKYSTERTNLEMLAQLNRAITALLKVAEYYDGSELLHQHGDIPLDYFENTAYDLEEKRKELFGNSLNWERIVVYGFQNLPIVERLNEKLEAKIGSEEQDE